MLKNIITSAVVLADKLGSIDTIAQSFPNKKNPSSITLTHGFTQFYRFEP